MPQNQDGYKSISSTEYFFENTFPEKVIPLCPAVLLCTYEDKRAMRIDCYISLHCSSKEALRENIRKALELESVEAEVNFYSTNEVEAMKLGLMGSPSLFINGLDILPGKTPGFS